MVFNKHLAFVKVIFREICRLDLWITCTSYLFRKHFGGGMNKCKTCEKEIDLMCQYDNFHHTFVCKLEIQLDQKDKRIAELEGSLEEACVVIKQAEYDLSEICTHYPKVRSDSLTSLVAHLNKPEIKGLFK